MGMYIVDIMYVYIYIYIYIYGSGVGGDCIIKNLKIRLGILRGENVTLVAQSAHGSTSTCVGTTKIDFVQVFEVNGRVSVNVDCRVA